jgi:hypothetical protein
MTSKERMLVALQGGTPDRLPITIHQWQPYHLQRHMGGMSALEAFRATGLDASMTAWDCLAEVASPDWRCTAEPLGTHDGWRRTRHTLATPAGPLIRTTASDPTTTFHVEPLIKTEADADAFLRYWPRYRLDRAQVQQAYDQTGDAGILRGFVIGFAQGGPWQDFCELVGTQRAIYWALDEPAFVHEFLDQMTRRKVAFVHDELAGARYDLIETGGGAASSTVISPAMFDEFCVPYDRRIHTALHEEGFRVVYHTCGGMMAILDRIPANGCDASETLSPPGVGGDIRDEDRATVKRVLGGKVALIGGIDQSQFEAPCPPESIAAQVRGCFETFGAGGAHICSASDHFFEAPPENLRALAAAAERCRYR